MDFANPVAKDTTAKLKVREFQPGTSGCWNTGIRLTLERRGIMANKSLLEDLVLIRDYVRENVDLLPVPIVDAFNRIAKHLGAVDGWCLFGIKGPKKNYQDPYVEKQY
jgi:hypothetical protein